MIFFKIETLRVFLFRFSPFYYALTCVERHSTRPRTGASNIMQLIETVGGEKLYNLW